MKIINLLLPTSIAGSLTLLGSMAAAQSQGELESPIVRPELSAAEFLSDLNALQRSIRPGKFVSVQGIGSGTVAPGGMVFGSVSGSDKGYAPGTGMDGSLSFGAGFGDADGSIGSQLVVNITSTSSGEFADSGYLSAKFGTRVLPSYGLNYIAANFDGIAPWGDSADMEVRTTLAFTTFRETGVFWNTESYPVMLTAGVSSHARNGSDPAPIFGAGIGLSQHLSTSMSYNGEYVNAGLGVKLPWIEGAAASLTINDLFDDEDRQRAVFSLSFATSALFGRNK